MDGSVVGLMGPNSSGKSTILRIIHFLMTAYTPPKTTQEQYIRRVDTSKEAAITSGWAEMIFVAQGATYKLRRTISANSSTRKLVELDQNGKEIPDKVYTRSEEVQNILTSVMGADKYAIDSAVFPEQGELNKILFGAQADREELLAKLLLLGHMAKAADIAYSKIGVLNAELQDYGHVRDEVQGMRNDAETALAAALSTANSLRDWSADINILNKYMAALTTRDDLGARQRTAHNKAFENNGIVSDLLDRVSNTLRIVLSSPADLDAWVTKVEEDLSSKRKLLEKLKSARATYTDIKRLRSACAALEDKISRLQSETVQPDANVYTACKSKYNIQVQLQSDLAALSQAQNELELQQTAQEQTAKELAARAHTRDTLTAEINAEANIIALLKTTVDTCQIALQGSCGADCPICGTDLSTLNLKERHAEFSEKYNAAESNARHKSFELSTLTTEIKKLETHINSIDFNINRAKEIINNCNAAVDGVVAEATEPLLNAMRAYEEEEIRFNAAVEQLRQLQAEQGATAKQLKVYKEEDLEAANSFDAEASITSETEIENTITRRDGVLQIMKDSAKTINTHMAIAHTNEENAEEAALAAEKADHTAAELYSTFSAALLELLAQNGECSETALNAAERLQKDYVTITAKAAELKTSANKLKARLQDIDNKIALDDVKRKLVADLQLVHNAFSRRGIPMAFIQHRFEDLVAMAQENLELMDANFAVIPHPDKPVCMQFYRTDEPGEVLFDHDLLSGAQRVRLSIAFLLAVQQLVIPDLGFLVLDEPSTHMDPTAKENLRDLLFVLNQELEATDTQILVCDHATELTPAFVKTIRLEAEPCIQH